MLSVQRLTTGEWEAAFDALPARQREPYWHPRFSEASATREGAEAMCLRVRRGEATVLYPFLRHAIPNAAGVYDAQTPYGYGGPLWVGEWESEDAAAALRVIGGALSELGVIAELIRCHPHWADSQSLEASGYRLIRVRTNVECVLDWEPGGAPSRWAPVARRNLRKAVRAGLRWRVGERADWTEFLRLYKLTFDRVGMDGSYWFDGSYLESLASIPGGLSTLLLVEGANVSGAVAASVVLNGGEIAFYHLGASDLDYREARPNDFLYWAMAQFARSRGCDRIVWGGGLANDAADTLFRFKRHFGDVETAVHIAGRILDRERFAALSDDWAQRNPERTAKNKLFLRYRG